MKHKFLLIIFQFFFRYFILHFIFQFFEISQPLPVVKELWFLYVHLSVMFFFSINNDNYMVQLV